MTRLGLLTVMYALQAVLEPGDEEAARKAKQLVEKVIIEAEQTPKKGD